MSTKHRPPRFSASRGAYATSTKTEPYPGTTPSVALTVEPSSRTRPAPRTRASKTDTFSKTFLSVPSTSVSRMTGQTVSADAARSEKGVATAPSLRSSATSATRSPATTSPNSSSGCTTRTSARRRHSDRVERYSPRGGQRQVRVQGDSRRRREFHENHSAHPGRAPTPGARTKPPAPWRARGLRTASRGTCSPRTTRSST